MIILRDGGGLIAGAGDEVWLPKTELSSLDTDPQTIQCGEAFFDVIGFSESRGCYLLKPIKIFGAADNIEDELDNANLSN